MNELKPCPFCGSKASLCSPADRHGSFYVVCMGPDCWCAMGENYDPDGMPDHRYYEAEQALAAWNARASSPDPASAWPECSNTGLEIDGRWYCVSHLPSRELNSASEAIIGALVTALREVSVPLQIQFDLHQRMCEQQGVDITTSKAYQIAKGRLDVANEAIALAENGCIKEKESARPDPAREALKEAELFIGSVLAINGYPKPSNGDSVLASIRAALAEQGHKGATK